MKREKQRTPPPEDGELDRIKLLKDQFDLIRRWGKFDKTRLLELFAFDVDDRGESGLVRMLGMVKWLRDIHTAPGGLTFLRLERAMSRGRLDKQYRADIQNLLNALFLIIDRAIQGEEKAQYQLQAFNRIAFPAEYDVSDEAVEKVANHLPKAVNELQRGRELLIMMDRISEVVEPKDAGEFLSPDTIVVLKADPDPSDLTACGHDLVAKVKSHKWNSKTTLRSLAVSIYLDQLACEDKNSLVDEAMLRKGIRTEVSRQSKSRQGPCWSLNVSQSRTEWNPFQISLLPLMPTKRGRKVSNKSQA